MTEDLKSIADRIRWEELIIPADPKPPGSLWERPRAGDSIRVMYRGASEWSTPLVLLDSKGDRGLQWDTNRGFVPLDTVLRVQRMRYAWKYNVSGPALPSGEIVRWWAEAGAHVYGRVVGADPIYKNRILVKRERGGQDPLLDTEILRLVSVDGHGPLAPDEAEALAVTHVGSWYAMDRAIVDVSALVRKRLQARSLDDADPPLLGMSGIRDPHNLCEGYVSSDDAATVSPIASDCQSDGHYLCAGCARYVGGDLAQRFEVNDDVEDIPF